MDIAHCDDGLIEECKTHRLCNKLIMFVGESANGMHFQEQNADINHNQLITFDKSYIHTLKRHLIL